MDNMRMPSISRQQALVYLAVVVLALVAGGRFLLGGDHGPSEASPAAAAVPALQLEQQEPSAAAEVVIVHVAGAVKRPGVFELPAGSRVRDAVASAGGPRRMAAIDLVNLAEPLVDGQQIVVPTRSPGAAGVVAPTAGPAPSGEPAKVRLNTATLEQLDTLPGVGPVTAQKILDYRHEHGPFSSVEELDAIPGIGPARLAELRELLVL
jgi:competence protein ComEA